MAFIPVLDTAQVQLYGRIDGQQTVNDLYFTNTTPGITLGELGDLADAIRAWYVSSMLTLLSSAFSLERVHARDLTDQFSFAVDVNAGPSSGSSGGAFVPNNVAPCISFRTGTAGRSGRGRNYIPGVPQPVVDGNTLTPGFIADAQAAYGSLLPGEGMVPAGWVWVVVSRYTGGAPRPAGIATPVLTALFTDNIVDSQRRRLPGRGA
jgi:hypothetical protein